MILINGEELKQDHFPDGTLNIKAPCKHKNLIEIEWKYENDAELFTLICLRKHYYNKIVILCMDYIPHARMDRVKNPMDVFTLKYFCETINSLNFKHVFVLDPHSNVALALLDRVVVKEPKTEIEHAINDIYTTVPTGELIAFYPDEGAMKRYSDLFHLRYYAFGIKKRNWVDGKIIGLDIANEEVIKDKNVLIVDDICSRGGTFYHSAKALKEYTDKDIYLYITHCEKTILDGELIKSGLIKKIYTANALFEIPEEYKDIIIEL